MKAGWAYSIAEFIGKNEGDIEDLFEPDIYVQMLNSAFNLNAQDNWML
ncbi:MAG: hypothetical protein WDO15_04885 [Bacteroidota bacterium]